MKRPIKFRMMTDVQIFHDGRWVTAFEYGIGYNGRRNTDGTVTAYSQKLRKRVVIKDTGLMVMERKERV